VFTNNDSAYSAALALHRAGVAIGAIIDVRPEMQLSGTIAQSGTRSGSDDDQPRRRLSARAADCVSLRSMSLRSPTPTR
jgi:hypothetical protein